MSERVRYVKPQEKSTEYEYTAEEAAAQQEADRKAQQLQKVAEAVGEVSVDLMAEIDAVLEENALEFVNQFVQKCGE